jgi:hypothetical protein
LDKIIADFKNQKTEVSTPEETVEGEA